MTYRIADFGPSDLLDSEIENQRRVKTSVDPELSRRLLSNLDPFEQSLVAEYTLLIEQKSIYGISALRDITETTGTGVVEKDGPEIAVKGLAAGDEARLSTAERGRYVAGAIGIPGLGARVSKKPTDADSGAEWGYFNGENGFGFGIDIDGLYVWVQRSGTVVFKRYQQDWTLDKLDGTGNSGIVIDVEDGNVFRMPFLWYGYGSIGFNVMVRTADRDKTISAEIASFKGSVSVDDPNLPVAVKAWGDCQVNVGGRQYGIYGRYNPSRRIVGSTRQDVSVGTTEVPLVSFRLRSDDIIYQSISIKLQGVDILSSEPLEWALHLDPTLTGANFVIPPSYDSSETATEYDVSATDFTGGQRVYASLASGGGGRTQELGSNELPKIDIPTNSIVTLTARSLGNDSNVTAILKDRQQW